ncbi:formimidoylglutamate deiminase [Actinomycetospora chibensis]|uniref:Formimidoylglutamate deiminase n=1 Tax=Actinomycetospora chibensis TaxID=663606 RepID=A0ABV9RMG6_9PSEU|nr:formimidoylglutamate deiminase [Actinomycetospora chibensis]MDD7926565.1 formimidoylglutamate deiminase [Actinomycetospora chibensis]
MSLIWCEQAWLSGGPAPAVALEIVDGRIAAITPGSAPAGTVLPGLTVPGLVNRHSHAFHRALRGHPARGPGSFWSWREGMYRAAAALDPDGYRALATAVYAEMALAGHTAVTEFHYLHHAPGGRSYADPIAMDRALVDAAAAAGLRLTLLDTCYLAAGFGRAPEGVQRRFADADVDAWAARASLVAALEDGVGVRVGAAIHSVRAVPREALPTVAAWARGRPLHVHLSEQPDENAACLAVHARTPTALLDEAGALGPATTAVHATHLTDDDVARLARTGARACFCPTTERDLGDGIGPAGTLAKEGVRLCLGSDSHAVVDPFEEMRALEMHERLRHGVRERFTPGELLRAGTDGAGVAVGEPADLVTVDTASVRTAGARPDGVLLVASASDVREVRVGGEVIVRDGVHQRVERPAARLAAEIGAVHARAQEAA